LYVSSCAKFCNKINLGIEFQFFYFIDYSNVPEKQTIPFL
jgi:hypothetical protein